MVWLDLEANLAIDAADQSVQDGHGDIDDRLAVGALQMGMRSRRGLVAWRGDSEMVDRGRTTDVCMGDKPQVTERGESAIDRRPVDSRSRSLGASDDLISGQVLFGAVEHFDNGLPRSGHPLVPVPEQAQRGADTGWGRRFTRTRPSGLHLLILPQLRHYRI